ncbi:MAG TPA: L,D-transpeptidase, partial [Polyangiaceae bacterium]|nr:L,D-transpeptidase [Polyangiaceae bacterium]
AAATARALPNSAFALLDVVEHEGRRLGLTTDLELVPLDRLTRVEPSTFHGVAFDEHTSLPLAFVRSRHAWLFAGSPERGLRPLRALSYREAVSLSGKTAKFDHLSYLETRDGAWLRDVELVHVSDTAARPAGVREGRTWVHVSIGDQTLVAYVGTRAVYATLVSTGAGGLGDPETTHATPRGEFLIHTKHVTSSMNGDELGDEFDLRDVPYVEYFTQGYAFHAAYWHDAFGAAHSHGCVNLSPLDARWLFHFTEPAVPQGWHGAFSREGTLVSITP